MKYISLPIQVDAEDVMQDAITYLQSKYPNWVPNSGNLDAAILLAYSTEAAQLRELASAVPDSIFRYFGATLMNLPPIDATPATVTTKWTAINNAGYLIPAGTQIAISDSNGNLIPFETSVDSVIAAGTTVLDGVVAVAIDEGAAGSGLGAVNGAVTLLDPLVFVASVTQDAVTSGGVDAEDDATYLDRLRTELALMSPRLILPADFALDAVNVPGVWRALAIDGYNPAGGGTYNNPRTVAVAVVDVNGNALDAGTKAAVAARQQAKREVNFIVNVIDPTYTQIDVSFTVAALAGYDHAQLLADATTAVTSFLSSATWGQDRTSTGDSAGRSWVTDTVVRYDDLVWILRSVAGVDHIVALTMGVHGGALGTADINLAGAAPLTKPATITGVVS